MIPRPPPSRAPAAGGCMLALGAIGGAMIGMMTGQASFGLVVGLVIGVGLAIMIFMIDRR